MNPAGSVNAAICQHSAGAGAGVGELQFIYIVDSVMHVSSIHFSSPLTNFLIHHIDHGEVEE